MMHKTTPVEAPPPNPQGGGGRAPTKSNQPAIVSANQRWSFLLVPLVEFTSVSSIGQIWSDLNCAFLCSHLSAPEPGATFRVRPSSKNLTAGAMAEKAGKITIAIFVCLFVSSVSLLSIYFGFILLIFFSCSEELPAVWDGPECAAGWGQRGGWSLSGH